MHPTQKRVIVVSQLKERNIGRHLEHTLKNRQGSKNQTTRNKTCQQSRNTVIEYGGECTSGDHANGDRKYGGDHTRHGSRLQCAAPKTNVLAEKGSHERSPQRNNQRLDSRILHGGMEGARHQRGDCPHSWSHGNHHDH